MERYFRATAPTRICDCGGWTDTWFARTGRVCHVAIDPGAVVDLEIRPRRAGEPATRIEAADVGASYDFTPAGRRWGAHPLLEAAIESAALPAEWHATVRVSSRMPPGASVGTSAAVTVALLGALRAATGLSLEPSAVASAAHAIETEWLGQQCGVQDQVAAAYGGINLVEIDEYPATRVRPIPVPPSVCEALQRQFVLVVMGSGHRSTAIHEQVIREVAGIGPGHHALVDLRQAASDAAEAIAAGQLTDLGGAMTRATEAQRRLHADLVSTDSQRVIDVGRRHGALGWKVNGAGGAGGSLTILGSADAHGCREMVRAIETIPGCRVVPVSLAHSGLSVV